MRTVRIDFDSPVDVGHASESVIKGLDDVTRVSGDPFDRHVAKHIRLADQIHGTERGKKAFVASADAKRSRNGPGVELLAQHGGEKIGVIICRNWAVATFESEPSPDVLARIRNSFQSLAPGDLSEYG